MLKKIMRGMEKWGHYLLALLCAGVILLSAVWTRGQQAAEGGHQAALSDQSQRLSQAAPKPEALLLRPPVTGEEARGYSEKPVYFPETGIWKAHPAQDFFAQEGETVRVPAAGVIEACGEGSVTVTMENGYACRVQGLKSVSVQPGQRVKAGAAIGTAGGRVPFEGSGCVCVSFFQGGAAAKAPGDWAKIDTAE